MTHKRNKLYNSFLWFAGCAVSLYSIVTITTYTSQSHADTKPTNFEVKYHCSVLVDKTRACVISESELEAVIAANNKAQARVTELKANCTDSLTKT
jgi:hypothetical protein